MVASNGVVTVARGGKKVEIICERGGNGRKGEEGSHAGLSQPHFIITLNVN